MSSRRHLSLLPSGVVAVLALALGACTGGSSPEEPGDAASSSAPPVEQPTATPVPAPDDRACYLLSFVDALAPTTTAEVTDCDSRHTSMTFWVGTLDTVVDGHLLAVDSERVMDQVAEACPARLADFVGGTLRERRLSMLRSVWFTPTVEQSDAGADWFRCDVIAVAGRDALAPLTGRLSGVLTEPAGRERWAMCATDDPDSPDFERVLCSQPHSWRAIEVVPFEEGRYPGVEAVREAGQTPCEDAGRAVADDALNFQWGYEGPSAEQWAAGQTYGRCWAPG